MENGKEERSAPQSGSGIHALKVKETIKSTNLTNIYRYEYLRNEYLPVPLRIVIYSSLTIQFSFSHYYLWK